MRGVCRLRQGSGGSPLPRPCIFLVIPRVDLQGGVGIGPPSLQLPQQIFHGRMEPPVFVVEVAAGLVAANLSAGNAEHGHCCWSAFRLLHLLCFSYLLDFSYLLLLLGSIFPEGRVAMHHARKKTRFFSKKNAFENVAAGLRNELFVPAYSVPVLPVA